MRHVKLTIRLIWLLTFIWSFHAQASAQKAPTGVAPGLYMPEYQGYKPFFLPLHQIPRLFPQADVDYSLSTLRTSPQPRVYQYEELALFCKMEVKLEKAFRFPIRMRLGDVPYVDWMEGKRKNY